MSSVPEDTVEQIWHYLQRNSLNLPNVEGQERVLTLELNFLPHPKVLFCSDGPDFINLSGKLTIEEHSRNGDPIDSELFTATRVIPQQNQSLLAAFRTDRVRKDFYYRNLAYICQDPAGRPMVQALVASMTCPFYDFSLNGIYYGCASFNPSRPLPKRLYHLQGERVIDTSSIPHGDSQSVCYAAISHKWSEGSDMQDEVRFPELPWRTRISASFLEMLKQQLVLYEIVEYVWIDVLCIHQDDAQDKAEEIPKMRQYFEEASFCLCTLSVPQTDLQTIIALGGVLISGFPQCTLPNPFAGAPGSLTRKKLILELCQLTVKLARDPWFHRVWTFQEAVVNPKTLLTAGNLSVSIEVFIAIVAVLHEAPNLHLFAEQDFTSEDQETLLAEISSAAELLTDILLTRAAYHHGEGLSLAQVLRLTEFRQCLHEVDRIFGILAVLPKATAIAPEFMSFEGEISSADEALMRLLELGGATNLGELMMYVGRCSTVKHASCFPPVPAGDGRLHGVSHAISSRWVSNCSIEFAHGEGTVFTAVRQNTLASGRAVSSDEWQDDFDSLEWLLSQIPDSVAIEGYLELLGIECVLSSMTYALKDLFGLFRATRANDIISDWRFPFGHYLPMILRSAGVSFLTEIKKILYAAVNRIQETLGGEKYPHLLHISGASYGWATLSSDKFVQVTELALLWIGTKHFDQEENNVWSLCTTAQCAIVVGHINGHRARVGCLTMPGKVAAEGYRELDRIVVT